MVDYWSVETGERWAYRARGIDPLVEVDVLKIGTNKPARVLVRFTDEAFEGREEWVPPNRLKVRWTEVESFLAQEEMWARVTASSPNHDDHVLGAAEVVFDELIPRDIAELDYRCAVLRTKNLDGLVSLVNIDSREITERAESFIEHEDQAWIAPFEAALLVATTAAKMNSETILRWVDQHEREARHEAIHGHHYPSSKGQDSFHFEPDHCREYDEKEDRPVREILRGWCGAQAIDRFDELAALRIEVRRIGDIAAEAIRALGEAGESKRATVLEQKLGIPVEMLRTDRDGES